MNSLVEIWQSVMDLLSGELTQTAVKTWFSDCTPIEISNNVLVIHTTSDFKRDIIHSRFEELICGALYELFSAPFELRILAGVDELIEYKEKKPVPAVAGDTKNNTDGSKGKKKFTPIAIIIGVVLLVICIAAIFIIRNFG